MRDPPRPILQHLDELRRRLTVSAILFAVGFIIAMIFYDPLIRVLLLPAGGHLSASSAPVVTGLTEFMGATLKIALMAGFILALPVIMQQFLVFASPAVSPRTVRFLALLFPSVLLLFACGVCLGYFMVVPTMTRFLLNFGSELVTPMIRISDYLNVMIMLVAGLGLAFETPVIMFILARFKIVSYKGFLRFWRHTIVLSFVIGAIFDPTPNPFDQIVVAGCIMILYAVGIFLAWITHHRQKSQETLLSEEGTLS
jgi:sec-independent protein translocase protein TatC